MKDGDNIATIGSSVANALVNNPQVDEPLRAYRIAKEWYSGGKQYSVTEDDLDYILNQWKKLPFTALLKGQVQQYLEDAKAKFVNKRE